jgi:hypothetical protein
MSLIYVPLTRGLYAVIDAADAEAVLPFKWTAQQAKRTHYAYRFVYGNGRPRKVYLHRLLMGDPLLQVDHINGDGLDCRRANMRLATPAQNRQNTRRKNRTGFIGVFARGARFGACICDGGRRIWLGTFDTPQEAGAAYAAAAAQQYGEFSPCFLAGTTLTARSRPAPSWPTPSGATKRSSAARRSTA